MMTETTTHIDAPIWVNKNLILPHIYTPVTLRLNVYNITHTGGPKNTAYICVQDS